MVKKLREAMIKHELDMLVVVSSDEHLNEYLPAQSWRLKASTANADSTGFTGSAGTAIFCVEDATSSLLIHAIICRLNKHALIILIFTNLEMKVFLNRKSGLLLNHEKL